MAKYSDSRPEPVAPKPPPKPALFSKPAKAVGMVRVPKGYASVLVELDVDGKVTGLKLGPPQTFKEYIAGEVKRMAQALCLSA